MSGDVKYSVNAGFFNAINEDRVYSADDMNRPYRRLISNGVFATPKGEASDDLQVFSANNGMNVIVSAGNAIIGDKWFENPSDLIITIPQNSEVLSRIDSIIAQIDKTQEGRKGNLVYRKGHASSNPIHPDINTEENIFEMRLADIEISPSCVKVTQDLITDCRGSSECPWVTSLIYQVDISTLFVQWQTAYQNFFEEFKQKTDSFFSQEELNFETWFEEIQNQLSDDAVGNLYNLINTKADKKKVYNITIDTTWTEEAPYTKNITVQGISSTDIVNMYPIWSTNLETRTQEKQEYSKISMITSNENSIELTCDEDKPSIALNVRIEVVY